MLITLFIGNGFDLNNGLQTKFTDFYDHIKITKSENDIRQNDIYSQIEKNRDKWSYFEMQLGQLTFKYNEEQKDNFLPYFIEKTSIKSDAETYLKLEGIDTKEIARKLTPKEAWLEEADFKKFAAKAAPIALLGFSMINGDIELGEIIEVIEQPHQVLCTILYKGNEALIPVHEASLLKVDQKKKKVYVDLPEGLLDIYG